jgi:hypothetical protein
MDVTILKVDVDGTTFNAPFGGNVERDETGEEIETGFDEEASRARGIAALVGLAFLLAGALVVRRVLADSTGTDAGTDVGTGFGEEIEIEG